MNSSFYNGVSGIKSHQGGIDIWANNINNVNSIGFKASSPEFSTIFSAKLSNNSTDSTADDKGLATTVTATATDFSSGAFVSTENQYDMAINGKGFFGVLNEQNEFLYTRAGAFQKDANGYLVDSNGFYVTGTSANNIQNNQIINNPNLTIDLNSPQTQTKIKFEDNLKIPPEATSYINIKGNLDPSITTKINPQTGLNEEIANIEVFRTNIIDSTGNENFLKMTFIKQVPQAKENIIWNVKVQILDKDQNIINTQDGVLNFDSKGALLSSSITSINNNGTNISLNFGSKYDGLVSFMGAETNKTIEKNGLKEGSIIDYGIDGYGNIIANFDNGKNIPIAKLAIFNFQNQEGLTKISSTYYAENSNSGKALFYKDENGKNIQSTTLKTKTLEMSNVSISRALTELIVMQKAFDASSKSITTSDQMIQNAINMKR